MDSDPAWKVARYVYECLEHRMESGIAIMSSEELCGSRSDEESSMWTEEFDEEMTVSIMADDCDSMALGA